MTSALSQIIASQDCMSLSVKSYGLIRKASIAQRVNIQCVPDNFHPWE